MDKLTGMHQFWYEDEPYEIQVESVHVDPQAGAAYYDFLLDDAGGVADPDLRQMQTVVLDPGHRTSDMALMSGRKAAKGGRSIATLDEGVWNVYEEMGRLLLSDHHVTLTPAQIDAYWWAGGTLRLAGEMIDLEPYMDAAVVPVAKSIAAAVARHAGDIRLWDTILLVGGGAPLFQPVLEQELGIPVRLAKDPQYANAAGYFKRQLER